VRGGVAALARAREELLPRALMASGGGLNRSWTIGGRAIQLDPYIMLDGVIWIPV
jgi:hypothetical protein